MDTILVFCSLYVIFVMLFVLQDILKSAWHQFKGTAYEWLTVKWLKEKREWWKWLLSISAFCVGIYYFIPNSIGGKADFRANRELPEYTSFYECEYDIEKYGSGEGYVSINKEDNAYCALYLFTDDGKISLDFYIEDDELESSCVRGLIEKDYEIRINIGNGPVERDFITLNSKDIYLPRDPVECEGCWEFFDGEYAFETSIGMIVCPHCLGDDMNALLDGEFLCCYVCGDFYYPPDSYGFGLCNDCCLEYTVSCRICDELTYRWYDGEFSFCPQCAERLFSDPYVCRSVEDWLDR